jgi:hypothetical protein
VCIHSKEFAEGKEIPVQAVEALVDTLNFSSTINASVTGKNEKINKLYRVIKDKYTNIPSLHIIPEINPVGFSVEYAGETIITAFEIEKI